MDERCLQCGHPTVGHHGAGCHRTSFLRGACDCDFVEPAPLPMSATAAQHRERAAWWSRRIDLTDHRMWQTPHGTEQWLRLERLRKVAVVARHHHLEMAQAVPDPDPVVPHVAAEVPAERDDPLRDVSIASLEHQPASALRELQDRFDGASVAARDSLRTRLETEFDALEPRHRRALLEDDALRAALTHLGVVSPWRPPTR
ncbi:MAG: hypothetical protein U0667_12385 [Chloroflexota bacterium]